MYSLISIYIIIPMIFSHIFSRFWSGFLISNGIGNFESIKIEFFLFLIILALIETLIFISREKWNNLKNTWWKVLIAIIIFAGISPIVYSHQNMLNILLWTWEKQHGILFIIGVILLANLLLVLSQKQLKKIAYIIIGTGVTIAIIAITESFFGYNIFTGLSFITQGSWSNIRSIATLGNPNYVAGYLLMILPMILGYVRHFEKYILLVIICFGILATKSVIGISLAWVYILYTIIQKNLSRNTLILLVISIISIFLFIYTNYHESEKWLSLTSRFILMKYVFLGYIDGSALSIIFGNGPDSISWFFAGARATEINTYFPENMIIDSSHNIILDILFSYWLIGVGICTSYIVNSWKNISHTNKSVIILGLLFFSLNVIIIVPILIFIFALQSRKRISDQ